ncbi:hydrogenase nickel incorporation protein HypB [Corynebacterium sp. SCR221107]|uniref:hydrogenase nickel incorporation protein HypB n=1 Tax=Corynebacterium sp. SCR221107 TaxID=3017361 RepID=UPI0022EC6E25|nr:hydrogenase nickel incorporation protein HypB [Corynebacterium sp. SCR221107]WBT09747.1 hydrogenase nickel incorporation protein HypB [Corynebacterium sp. SCR221107]
MGRFHRHDDGTVHSHEHDHDGHGHVHSHSHAHDHHDHVHDHEHPHAHDHEHEHYDVGDHSGYETGRERIEVLEDIFSENDRRAASNQAAFEEHGVTSINVMSSPGAGKTTLLEKTLQELGEKVRFGVVEGDIETALDADRLRGFGAQVSLLNTGNGFGGECHLDAPMVAHALEGLDLSTLDVVLIENVGNLVCPAEFEVGAQKKAMVASVTEGEDKPLKYPVMFRSVEVVVINKIDLLPYLDFDMDLFKKNIRQVNPNAEIIEVSTKTGEGLDRWYAWLQEVSA